MSVPPGPPPGPPSGPLPEPRDPHIRIGNPEREAVVARLDQALHEGRLDLVEYDDRVRQVYAAKTASDLTPLTADLPAPPPLPAPAPKRSLTAALIPDERRWLGVAIVLTAVWLVQLVTTHRTAYFWPAWPIGIWGAVLLARRITGGR